MSKEIFYHLHHLIEPKIKKKDTRLRKCVCARERLVITLRYLSTGCSQQTLSFAFRLGRTTICRIVKEVCIALHEVLSPIYLRPPKYSREWKKISDDFFDLWHVIGAIDGKHIAIDCQKGSGTQDCNYKGFYSIVLLAVCDAKYNFTTVDVGAYGSNNDSGVLLNSEMGQQFEEEAHDIPKPEPLDGCKIKELLFYLVGDEISPLKTWMMRPYSESLNEQQSIFNYRLSKARRFIENTFGILVARWRLLRGPIGVHVITLSGTQWLLSVFTTIYDKLKVLHTALLVLLTQRIVVVE